MLQAAQAKVGRTGVFISYSHKDRAVLNRLKQFLIPFERAGGFQYWDDTRIEAGMDWRVEIRRALNSTKVAILLITADFLASEFIVQDELPPLLAAAENDGAIIVPVIVGPSAFKHVKSLSRFQAINDPERPLKGLSAVKRDEILAKLADRVRGALTANESIEILSTGAQESDLQVDDAKRQQRAADKQEAVKWLRKSAEDGNIGAQAELGAWYAIGEMVEKDYDEAYKWLNAAAEKGNPKAQYNLALLYVKGAGVTRDFDKAFKYLTFAAENGHADAQYNLGDIYRAGKENIAQDYVKAREWYGKAAQQGHLDALSNLGALYKLGLGGPPDSAEAVKYVHEAAEKGHASAQHNLGIMYRQGDGVPADAVEACKWFRKAAQQGDAEGQNQIGVHLVNGWGTPQNYAEAVQWFEKAAKQGNASAEFNLSVMYGQGKGVEVDPVKALAWARQAAEHGHEQAQKLIASLVK